MNKPSHLRAWLKIGLFSAGKTIVLAALGPQLGGFLVLLVSYMLGYRPQPGGGR